MLAALAREPLVSGACLVDRRGAAHDCLWVCGELEPEAERIEGAQFVDAVDSLPGDEGATFALLGLKFFRVQMPSLCSVLAVSQQRRACVLVSAVPVGVLVTVFRYPVLPQQAVPVIEAFCAKLRA